MTNNGPIITKETRKESGADTSDADLSSSRISQQPKPTAEPTLDSPLPDLRTVGAKVSLEADLPLNAADKVHSPRTSNLPASDLLASEAMPQTTRTIHGRDRIAPDRGTQAKHAAANKPELKKYLPSLPNIRVARGVKNIAERIIEFVARVIKLLEQLLLRWLRGGESASNLHQQQKTRAEPEDLASKPTKQNPKDAKSDAAKSGQEGPTL
jgi:hypothetical protein